MPHRAMPDEIFMHHQQLLSTQQSMSMLSMWHTEQNCSEARKASFSPPFWVHRAPGLPTHGCRQLCAFLMASSREQVGQAAPGRFRGPVCS